MIFISGCKFHACTLHVCVHAGMGVWTFSSMCMRVFGCIHVYVNACGYLHFSIPSSKYWSLFCWLCFSLTTILKSFLRLCKMTLINSVGFDRFQNSFFFLKYFTETKRKSIHNECPWRVEISHPMGRNFNQGRGFRGPWFQSLVPGFIPTPKVRFLYGLFFSHFSKVFFLSEHKNVKKTWKLNFLPTGFTLFLICSNCALQSIPRCKLCLHSF